MAYGFLALGQSGRVQIDETYKNARLFTSGYANTQEFFGQRYPISVPIPDNVDAPLVLLRPSAPEVWVGAVRTRPRMSTGGSASVNMEGTGPFYYAIFDTNISPISDGNSFGLRVLTSSGAETFSSNYRYPRISSIHYKPASSALGSGWPVNSPYIYTISGHTFMPWILGNTLVGNNGEGVGDDTEQVPCAYATINSTFTQLKVAKWNQEGAGARNDTVLWNPYGNRDTYFGVARYVE